MPGHNATRGRIEYQFKVFGGLTFVFIEVKLEVGSAEEHLNAVAQVIAESDGTISFLTQSSHLDIFSIGYDYANGRMGFGTFPIYAILCDGKSFEFFCFDSSTKPPTFTRGRPHNAPMGRYALSVADFGGSRTIDFIMSLRPVCETIFYFLLLGYQTGIVTYCQRSCSQGEAKGKRRESTDAWQKANSFAEQALLLAKDAAERAAAGDYELADQVAQSACSHLKSRLASAQL